MLKCNFCERVWNLSMWYLCKILLTPSDPTSYNFTKKRIWHRCSPVNFAKFLRTNFLIKIWGGFFCFCVYLKWDILQYKVHVLTIWSMHKNSRTGDHYFHVRTTQDLFYNPKMMGFLKVNISNIVLIFYYCRVTLLRLVF